MSASIRSTTAQSITSVLGTVTTTASTISSAINSLGYLAASGEVKAKLFHDRVKTNAVNQDFLYRQIDKARTLDRIATHHAELATKLADPNYKALFEAAEKELAAHTAANP
jgi:hypothetical protein